jgi:hypothetical protein
MEKVNQERAAAWQRWNQQALESVRQDRIRRVANEQAQAFARMSKTAPRAILVEARSFKTPAHGLEEKP